jgi:pre-mRNA-splicing factor ATP-dependent RNA helicase DHX15/PRP43
MADDSTKHPLFGFMPRRVTAKQVRGVIVRADFTLFHIEFLMSWQDGDENPFTRSPYSDQYYKILEARRKLPVYEQMDGFYKLVSSALPFVCEGQQDLEPRSKCC